jgi:hypothetical protein
MALGAHPHLDASPVALQHDQRRYPTRHQGFGLREQALIGDGTDHIWGGLALDDPQQAAAQMVVSHCQRDSLDLHTIGARQQVWNA